MEVTVLSAENVPERSVIDIRMGPSRKQVPLEVGRPIALPDPGSQQFPVEVGLFSQMASQILPTPEQGMCEVQIPVRDASGNFATQVQLRVRPSPNGHTFCEEASLNNSLGGSGGNSHADEDTDRLLVWFQGQLNDVLREQPADPMTFLLGQLRKKKQDTITQLSERSANCSCSATSSGSSGSSTAAPSGPSSHVSDAMAVVTQAAGLSSLADALAPKPRPPEKPFAGRSGRTLGRQATRQKVVSVGQAPDGGPGGAEPPPMPEAQAPESAQPQPQPAAPEAPVMPQRRTERSNSQIAARFSVALILQGSACQAAAEESIRDKVRSDVGLGMATSAIARVTGNILSEAKAGTLSRPLSRCASRSGQRKSPNSRGGISLSEAAARAGEDRRNSLPTPIVSLGAERNSWGSWLCN